ncbi:ATP-binding cassette domain-containing protein [Altererythrobacter sp. ZODW24]|uniref:ABC transporter ATP-binding protein n=1 Tax=Altererythrobacter sp. ZODW24 TaxID=2185142 RepID=UPI000DF7362B|nr:ATP-binding cassette domain-containing protein [Altererythrobacter sp. ZODW24]
MHSLSTHQLTKRFGDYVAVDAVDLEIPTRAIYGFLGANGAGKSTTLRMALGLLKPDSGTISYFGQDLSSGPRPLIGAVTDSRGGALYDHLTAQENLRLTCRLISCEPRDISRVLELVDLSEARYKKVAEFSTGMRQRLAIARALLGNPRLIILDEPLNGLDPSGIRQMRALLRMLVGELGITLVLCSHLLDEVELIADHVGLMHQGKLIHQGSISQLLTDRSQLIIESDFADRQKLANLIAALGSSCEIGPKNTFVLSDPKPGSAPEAAIQLNDMGARIFKLEQRTAKLEEIYHEYIRAAA